MPDQNSKASNVQYLLMETNVVLCRPYLLYHSLNQFSILPALVSIVWYIEREDKKESNTRKYNSSIPSWCFVALRNITSIKMIDYMLRH